MAKVLQNQVSVVVEPWWAKGRSVYVGLSMGLLWWIFTVVLNKYVVEPLACRDLSTATACVNSFDVSGSIAAVLVAAAGTFLLVRYLEPRPIVVAVSAAIVLWLLGVYVDGLSWWASLLWGVGLYGATYGLFALVTRIPWLWLSMVVAGVIAIGIRLLLAI